MHRTNRVIRTIAWGRLWALLLGGLAALGADAPQPPPQGKSLIVPINGTQRLQMAKKQIIQKAINEKETTARVSPVVGDPTTVLITGLEPGLTRVTLIDDAGTQEVYEIVVQLDIEYLKSLLKRAVPTASVIPIPGANNSIILTGTVARTEDIQPILQTTANAVGGPGNIINAMRVGGVMTVQLDVVIARVARSQIRQMGFNWLLSGTNSIAGNTIGGVAPLTEAAVSGGTAGGGGGLNGGVGTIGNGGPIGLNPSSAPANLFLALTYPGSSVFNMLQLLKTENLAKILAAPRLTTLSGRPATFLSGGQQAVPQVSGFGGTAGVQFVPFGTQLTCLPIVLGNGKIYLDVCPSVSQLDAANGTPLPNTPGIVPGRNIQSVQTSVEIEDGQTLVIGGLIQSTVQGSVNKVPVLGDLPYVGALFSTKNFQETEEELLVLVTPHLVDPMSCDQLPKVLPGQETRSPDDFELFLEQILEAPRGQREVWQNKHYVPPYKNGPSGTMFPCGDQGVPHGFRRGGPGGCGSCSPSPAPAGGMSPAEMPPPLPAPTLLPPTSTLDNVQDPTMGGNNGARPAPAPYQRPDLLPAPGSPSR